MVIRFVDEYHQVRDTKFYDYPNSETFKLLEVEGLKNRMAHVKIYRYNNRTYDYADYVNIDDNYTVKFDESNRNMILVQHPEITDVVFFM